MLGGSSPLRQAIWRAKPSPCISHQFDDGVVLYRASDKSTLYLPAPLAGLLAILQASEAGLSEADMAQILVEAGWPADDTLTAIETLANQQLIAIV